MDSGFPPTNGAKFGRRGRPTGCTFSGFLVGVMEAQFVAIPRIGVDEAREERTAQVCRGNPGKQK